MEMKEECDVQLCSFQCLMSCSACSVHKVPLLNNTLVGVLKKSKTPCCHLLGKIVHNRGEKAQMLHTVVFG